MSSDFNNFGDVMNKIDEIGHAPVLSSLRERRSQLHPDKNGGLFKSEADEKQYHFLDDAIKQVELKAQSDSQLIPISQLPAIVESITKSIAIQNEPNSAEIERAFKESLRSDLSRKYIGPKIGSGIFAVITGFLFSQAKSLIEHPVVGGIFETKLGMDMLILMFVSSVVLFVITWIKERREDKLSNYLLSEESLREIYYLVKELSDSEMIETNDIRRAIRGTYSHRRVSPFDIFIRPKLSYEIMDKILEVQLQRLIDRKVIEVVDIPSIERVYRVIV